MCPVSNEASCSAGCGTTRSRALPYRQFFRESNPCVRLFSAVAPRTRLSQRGTSGSVQRGPANPARPGREQRYRVSQVCRGDSEVPRSEESAQVNNWPSGALTRFWMFQGRRNYRRKRYSEALKYFDKIIAKGSASAAVLASAAFCLTELNRYSEAIDLYQRALPGNAQHGHIHAQLARNYSELKHPQEAYDSLHRAFRINPEFAHNPYWLQILGTSA
jgi:hypothetical protein